MQTTANMRKVICLASFFVLANLWHSVGAKSGGEVTANPRMRLCGVEILHAHKAYCEEKQQRSLNDDEQAEKQGFIKEKLALSFLQKKSRQKRHLRGWYSNVSEECCQEKCSLEEVAEYRCS